MNKSFINSIEYIMKPDQISSDHTSAIYTIGHSTRSIDEFLNLLKNFNIQLLADIRNYPGSKRFPQFNKEQMEIYLPENGIGYIHFKDLGGRRKPLINSHNTAWRNSAFRGYADCMETEPFKKAVVSLETHAYQKRTAIMCSEAVWWSCHRSLLSDYLKYKGWKVWHIMDINKATEHPYTQPAKIINNQLTYQEADLFK